MRRQDGSSFRSSFSTWALLLLNCPHQCAVTKQKEIIFWRLKTDPSRKEPTTQPRQGRITIKCRKGEMVFNADGDEECEAGDNNIDGEDSVVSENGSDGNL